jgi:hypothetical protein
MITDVGRAGLGAVAQLLDRGWSWLGRWGILATRAGEAVGADSSASGCEGEGGCLFALVHHFARGEVEAWGE